MSYFFVLKSPPTSGPLLSSLLFLQHCYNWWQSQCRQIVRTLCAFFSHVRGERKKQAVGISIQIIRPSHLLKKLLPAAVKESQTSRCSSSSIEQLRLSSREATYDIWSCALSPPCLHPTTQQPNNGGCGSRRHGSKKTSEAGLQTDHCSRAE